MAAADEAAAKLRALPQVAHVVTLSTFIPDRQKDKLPLIAAAEKTLHPALYPASVTPPPTDAENVKTINAAVETLNRLAADDPRPRRRGGKAPRRRHDCAREGR